MALDTPLNRSILFGVLLTLLIPSVICSLFIFYCFARCPELLRRLNNHVIVALLVISFIQVTTEMPFVLIVLYTGFVAVQSSLFCHFWIVYNYGLIVINLWFMAYGCIERYLLVFCRVFFKRHLILLHYGPLAFFFIYPPLLYVGLVVIYGCQPEFDYTQAVCGGACYQYKFTLGLYDWLSNVGGPVIVGAIATTTLIVRVFVQKRRVRQRGIWRRNRKMVVQLASVSIMYIAVWIPSVVCFVVPLIIPDPFALELGTAILNYIQYVSCLLCPFMCLIGLPDIRDSIKRMFVRPNNVQPMTANPIAPAPRVPRR